MENNIQIEHDADALNEVDCIIFTEEKFCIKEILYSILVNRVTRIEMEGSKTKWQAVIANGILNYHEFINPENGYIKIYFAEKEAKK